jgi:hypothetical protein
MRINKIAASRISSLLFAIFAVELFAAKDAEEFDPNRESGLNYCFESAPRGHPSQVQASTVERKE